jgi:hypothetical protein
MSKETDLSKGIISNEIINRDLQTQKLVESLAIF